MKHKWFALVLTGILVWTLSGCGETVRGVGRDIARVGRGVRTIFVSD